MTKISIQQLASYLPSELFGADEQNRIDFIKVLFDAVTVELEHGNDVTIKGLGRFSLTENPDNPIQFEPDMAAIEIVNAPFIGFQPEILAYDVTDQMLARYDEPQPPLTNETEYSNESSVEIEEPLAVDVPQSSSEPETSQSEPIHVESSSVVIVDEPTTTVGCLADMEAEAPTEPAPVVASTVVADPIIEKSPVDTTTAFSHADGNHDYRHEEPQEHATRYEYERQNDASQTAQSYSGFWIGFIAGLAVGLVAFLIYVLYDVNADAYRPDESDEPDEVTTELLTVDPLLQESVSQGDSL